MKKLIIGTIILITTLLVSCSHGCGCPGNAGYGQNDQSTTLQFHIQTIQAPVKA